MDQTIKRIHIVKLSSTNNSFREIVFRDGLNLILGERCDEKTTKGRKTNGVGKTMSIEFIDFCFLCDYEKSRIAKIPPKVLKPEECIVLDLKIGNDEVQIRRCIDKPDKPIVIRNGKETQFENLDDARNYISDLVFTDVSETDIPTYRNLLSILSRDERSEFSGILKCHDVNLRIPDDLTVHLYLLGLSISNYKRIVSTIKRIDSIKVELRELKKDLTENGNRNLTDVKAKMNALKSEVEQLEKAIDLCKTNNAIDLIEDELVEIEKKLDLLRLRRSLYRRELSNIKALPQPEQVDDTEIELVYNQYKEELGTAVVKSLNEVISFKNKVEEFQKVLINEKACELDAGIEILSSQIRELDEEYARKVKLIDKQGVLQNIKTSFRVYDAKRNESLNLQSMLERYNNLEGQKKQLELNKSSLLLEIDKDIKSLSETIDSFIETISNIHELIMGNRECSFEIKTKNSSASKTPIEINMRIFDDGSHSVDRTKVYIYDMALMFNNFTRTRHPLFLIHDNIFDVDQDTLVQCLNFLAKQEDLYTDFQYILTLNRDKIENEEKAKQINLNINEHVVASFTKENKFLLCDYQELE